MSIFDAAADWWELAILDTHTVTIDFDWDGLGRRVLGSHALTSQGGSPNRETSAIVKFDNSGTHWFIDPTPYDNSEYGTFTEFFSDLGGGSINVGRVFTDPIGFAIGRFDLLSVAMHEIGHALGLSSANTSFTAENGDGDIDVVGGSHGFGNSVIPTSAGSAHLDLANALMYPSFGTSTRKLQSSVDILANAEISDFNTLDLDPANIPEPGTLLLLGFGLLGVAMYQRREKSKALSA